MRSEVAFLRFTAIKFKLCLKRAPNLVPLINKGI